MYISSLVASELLAYYFLGEKSNKQTNDDTVYNGTFLGKQLTVKNR